MSRPRGSSHQPFLSHCSSDTCELTGQQSWAELGWAEDQTRVELGWAGTWVPAGSSEDAAQNCWLPAHVLPVHNRDSKHRFLQFIENTHPDRRLSFLAGLLAMCPGKPSVEAARAALARPSSSALETNIHLEHQGITHLSFSVCASAEVHRLKSG